MYTRFAERERWKTEIISGSETGIGGYKEIVFRIDGVGAYRSSLKFESGVHRVQRVPDRSKRQDTYLDRNCCCFA